MDLETATDSNATDDLRSKNTQLEDLRQDRSEVQKQPELNQEEMSVKLKEKKSLKETVATLFAAWL